MSLDFLDSPCKEPSRNEKLFGLCDDQNGTKAYSDHLNSNNWIAKVINEDQVDVTFTPIDLCMNILKAHTNDQESTCDGMLTSENCLYLVELKEQGTGGWLPKATDQLESTIKLLTKNHDLSGFRFKKAFPCNKRHPNFKVIDHAENLRFFRNYGFRIDAQLEVRIR
ncbi:MAG TPA: hypothetical protein VGC08_02350 [Pedobacter sp.]